MFALFGSYSELSKILESMLSNEQADEGTVNMTMGEVRLIGVCLRVYEQSE